MKLIATITSKGQITIPVTVRRMLGLRTGDGLEFDVQPGKIELRPAKSAQPSAGVLKVYLPKGWKAKTPEEMDAAIAKHLERTYRGA